MWGRGLYKQFSNIVRWPKCLVTPALESAFLFSPPRWSIIASPISLCWKIRKSCSQPTKICAPYFMSPHSCSEMNIPMKKRNRKLVGLPHTAIRMNHNCPETNAASLREGPSKPRNADSQIYFIATTHLNFLGWLPTVFILSLGFFFFFSDYRCNNVPCKNSNNTEAYEAGISTALPAVCRHHSRNGKCRNGEAEGISVRGIYEYSEGQRQAVSVQTKK